jgi:hypothetical protein
MPDCWFLILDSSFGSLQAINKTLLEGFDRNLRSLVSFTRTCGQRGLNHLLLGFYTTLLVLHRSFRTFSFMSWQVTFPNGVFSGTIISSVIHNGDIKKTAEWQLLLGAIALPGVFIGALLCNPLGRRNTV